MSKAERFIDEHTRNCSNIMEGYYPNGKQAYFPWISRRHARKAVEIAREEMIEKACKWLKDYKSPLEELGLHIFIDDGFINDIKQAMKDE